MNEPEPVNYDFLYGQDPPRPSAGTWVRHLLLLAVTFCTTTLAGFLYPFGRFMGLPDSDPKTASEAANLIASLPSIYVKLVSQAVYLLATHSEYLREALSFSLSLLFILTCHEMGHYIACRIYKVDATLPFFLPTPPLLGPAGTFGAFIKIRSPMPSRRAVFDIGVAGPIAGFVALIPIAFIGIATMQIATPEQISANQGGLVFNDPLFTRIIGMLFGVDLRFGIGNPFYFASWVGLLVTALNLIPSGQLDGGHAIYAVFGERLHYWTGRIAFGVMAALSIAGLYFFGSPSGILIALILAVMMRVRHPQPLDQTPLDTKRKVIAAITLMIFILCFVPFPIQIN